MSMALLCVATESLTLLVKKGTSEQRGEVNLTTTIGMHDLGMSINLDGFWKDYLSKQKGQITGDP